MMIDPEHLPAILETYLLEHDLAPATEAYYRRVVSVFRLWAGRGLPQRTVDANLLSEFLREKQRAGRSDYYVKSLRAGLLAILGDRIESKRVRTIRPTRLEPESWTRPQVAAILGAVNVLPEYKRDHYRLLCRIAFHTGLSKVDIDLLERSHFRADGVLVTRRHRTGELVVAWIPPRLLGQLPSDGLVVPRRWSDEQFREDFRRIVAAAGLTGTFKRFRKTSGTEADILTGRGHEHLANSRRVFERHYLDQRRVHREPIRLPPIRATVHKALPQG